MPDSKSPDFGRMGMFRALAHPNGRKNRGDPAQGLLEANEEIAGADAGNELEYFGGTLGDGSEDNPDNALEMLFSLVPKAKGAKRQAAVQNVLDAVGKIEAPSERVSQLLRLIASVPREEREPLVERAISDGLAIADGFDRARRFGELLRYAGWEQSEWLANGVRASFRGGISQFLQKVGTHIKLPGSSIDRSSNLWSIANRLTIHLEAVLDRATDEIRTTDKFESGNLRKINSIAIGNNILEIGVWFGDIMTLLTTPQLTGTAREKIEEEVLSNEYGDRATEELLANWLKLHGVPKEKRATLAAEILTYVDRTMRPKWLGRRERGGKLAVLNAPSFFKAVHPDLIAADRRRAEVRGD